ncbi:MAG: GH3 auxin-responsive promoter family protein [Bacteroidales bacterium]
MALIGEIFKKTIEIADKIFTNPDPKAAQKDVLKQLLKKAENTAFGKFYQFKHLLLSDYDLRHMFSEAVPYHSYDNMLDRWWYKVLEGGEDVAWPGKVKYFAVSSGTTSKKKYIPVTEEMLKSIRNAGMLQIKGVADFGLPPEFFEKELLLFGSNTDLKKVNDHYEGEISGISVNQLPFWLEGFYRPGRDISSINDWDKRVEALAKKAPGWDIGSISGIPSWIELMLKRVIEYHNLKNIHDIWPNFMVFTSGGVAFEPYKKSFERITGKSIIVIDTYLTSEGYLATQTRRDTDAMALFTDNGIYFEFVPFTDENIDEHGNIRSGAKAMNIEDVEEGVQYVLVISTVAGAWRYMIGDTIEFTDKNRAEIKITGRTKHFLNVVGSQLSVIQMNRAIKELGEEFDIDIKEFTVAALVERDNYLHRWYLGVEDQTKKDTAHIARRLDEILEENNKNYKVARSKALKSVEVRIIPNEIFHLWTEETKQKGGQVKMPRVMKEGDFREWEKYVAVKLKP